MEDSDAPLLVEFSETEGRIGGYIHRVGNRVVSGSVKISNMVSDLLRSIDRLLYLEMPVVVPDDWEVPKGNHKGSFGYQRKFHIHEGIDICVPKGTSVTAMEQGLIVGEGQFTGEAVGSPWWKDTWYCMIEGASGTILYGEIDRLEYGTGEYVYAGDHIGYVTDVLKEDEGNGKSMLHLEWYRNGITHPVAWVDEKPYGLLDPTILLEVAKREW